MAKAKKKAQAAEPSVLVTGERKGENIARLNTPAFTASYVKVLEPSEDLSGRMKYSISMVFDKDKVDLDLINEAIAHAASEKFGKKLPRNFKSPLRDGDEDRPDSPEYENSWFINATSTRKPQVVNHPAEQRRLVNDEGWERDDTIVVTDDSDESGIYSGCKCRASVTFFGFDQAGNKGVGCGLNNIEVLRRDERIGGGASAESDFHGQDYDTDQEVSLDDL